MPRGDKSKYTDKQERKAEHIEESYEKRGVPKKEAEARAWATVNKDDGGGKKPGGSGRGKTTGHPAAKKGGKKGGAASAARPAAARKASTKKSSGHAQASRNVIYRPFGGITWMLECTAALPSAVTLRSVVLMKRPIGDRACAPLLSGP